MRQNLSIPQTFSPVRLARQTRAVRQVSTQER